MQALEAQNSNPIQLLQSRLNFLFDAENFQIEDAHSDLIAKLCNHGTPFSNRAYIGVCDLYTKEISERKKIILSSVQEVFSSPAIANATIKELTLICLDILNKQGTLLLNNMLARPPFNRDRPWKNEQIERLNIEAAKQKESLKTEIQIWSLKMQNLKPEQPTTVISGNNNQVAVGYGPKSTVQAGNENVAHKTSWLKELLMGFGGWVGNLFK